MGIFNKGNAAKKIREFKEFTLNLPSEGLMYEIEVAGFNSSKDKNLYSQKNGKLKL